MLALFNVILVNTGLLMNVIPVIQIVRSALAIANNAPNATMDFFSMKSA